MTAIIITKEEERDLGASSSSEGMQRSWSALESALSLSLSGQSFQSLPLPLSESLFLSEPHCRTPPQPDNLAEKETDPICKFRCVHHCLFLPTFFPFFQSFLFKRNDVFSSEAALHPPRPFPLYLQSEPSHQITHARDFQKPDACFCYSSTSCHHLPFFLPCQTTQVQPSLSSLSIHSSIHLPLS